MNTPSSHANSTWPTPSQKLTSLTPTIVVGRELKMIWNIRNQQIDGDLKFLFHLIKSRDFTQIESFLQEPLGVACKDWISRNVQYFQFHIHSSMDDKTFAKKVGRILVERALFVHFPDGPYADQNNTWHDRIVLKGSFDTPSKWPEYFVDYLLQESFMPWMARHVSGWTRDSDPNSKEFIECLALQDKIKTRYGVMFDHVQSSPPSTRPMHRRSESFRDLRSQSTQDYRSSPPVSPRVGLEGCPPGPK